MKKSKAIILSLIIFFSLSFSVFARTYYLYPSNVIKNKNSLQLVAHRGLNSLAPENSLAAFRLAGEHGFPYCEFDIYPTTDGRWAVMHDSTIDRMTNGSGNIIKMSYSELLTFTIDSGTNVKKYSSEKIPELSQVLDICRDYSVSPVIEIKGGSTKQLKALCSYLSGRNEKNSFVVASFSAETLKTVREYMPSVRIWLLTFAVNDYDITLCKKYGFECLDSSASLTGEDDVKKVTGSGLKSGVWSVDSVSGIEKFYSLGVRYVTTNKVLPLSAPAAESTSKASPPTTKSERAPSANATNKAPSAVTTENNTESETQQYISRENAEIIITAMKGVAKVIKSIKHISR